MRSSFALPSPRPAHTALLATALVAGSLAAQPPLVRLDALIAGNGQLTAGDVTFSDFAAPLVLPPSVTSTFGLATPIPEFGDVAVSAVADANGTVSLSFVMIDPATGLPQPLTVGATAGAEKVRAVRYTMTVTNPALRAHAVDQTFGPGLAITGASTPYLGMYAIEPVPAVFDQLMRDFAGRTTLMPLANGAGFNQLGPMLLPGGDLATYRMASVFGFANGRFGSSPGGSLDSVTVSFVLDAAGSPVPAVTPNLAANGLFVNSSGLGTVVLTDFAQEGGVTVALASSDPTAQPVPAFVTVPQGSMLGAFALPDATVTTPTPVTITADYAGALTNAIYTAVPPTPLALAGITPLLQPSITTSKTLRVVLNREPFTSATISLTSSDPSVAPVPATVTIPGYWGYYDVVVPLAPVPVNTPVTITASFAGSTASHTFVVAAPSEVVRITKAEFNTRTGNLKVEATSSEATASLSLFDATIGRPVGVMTFNGTSGSGAKFQFQGVVPPIFVLRAISTLGGVDTVSVAQK